MAMNATTLATDIKAALTSAGFNLGYSGSKTAEMIDIIAEKIVNHIIANMEIKGVTVALDSGVRTIETYTTGVGDHTGALNSVTGGPVSGAVKSDKLDVGTQDNDGTGRVA